MEVWRHSDSWEGAQHQEPDPNCTEQADYANNGITDRPSTPRSLSACRRSACNGRVIRRVSGSTSHR